MIDNRFTSCAPRLSGEYSKDDFDELLTAYCSRLTEL